ncbi:unnamed protein product [Closterium sp. NIES-53]
MDLTKGEKNQHLPCEQQPLPCPPLQPPPRTHTAAGALCTAAAAAHIAQLHTSQQPRTYAAACIALTDLLPPTKAIHFSHAEFSKDMYDAIVAHYSTPSSASLNRLLMPFVFLGLCSFETISDLVTHMRSLDTSFCATCTEEQLKLTPLLCCPIYMLVTLLPDRRSSSRDVLLLKHPTVLTINLLESTLTEIESNLLPVAVATTIVPPRVIEGHAVPNLPTFTASIATAELSSSKTCGRFHTAQRCFFRLDDAWREQFPDATELPRWADLLRKNIDIFALDFDAILGAMYALTISVEGDCYLSVPPDPGIGTSETAPPGASASAALGPGEAGALGASESAALGPGEATTLGASASAPPGASTSALAGTTSTEALHTFTLDSGASRCFFRDRTALEQLARPVAVSLADPSGGPVIATSSIVLPCPAVPSGTQSGLYLPSFSTSLVAGSALQDGGQLSTPCSCCSLSHQTVLWHHRLGHPSVQRLRGMHSRYLVSGLPRVLPPLPPSPAPPCLPCVEGRQRVAPHSSSFPPTEAPLQTLHLDVWGPARVRGQGHERYFLLVVDDYTRYTTVFPLRTKGGEFSSDLLAAYCAEHGIRQTFTLPASPQQNGVAERRIGLVMEIARTSLIHAAAPHFLWPFAVQYAAHQLNLWPRVSAPETSPTLLWAGQVGDASRFRVWGAHSFVRDTTADKLSARAVPCVFLGFVPNAPGWPVYHPTSRRVFASQDVTFDESVAFYRLFPYCTAPLPPPRLSSSCQRGAEPGGAATGGAEPGGAATGGAEPGGAVTGGAEPGGAATGGTETEGTATRGAAPWGTDTGGAEPRGSEPGGGDPAGAPSSQLLREWYARRCSLRSGAPRSDLPLAGATGGATGAVGGAAGAAGGSGATGAVGGTGAPGGATGAGGGTRAAGGAAGGTGAAVAPSGAPSPGTGGAAVAGTTGGPGVGTPGGGTGTTRVGAVARGSGAVSAGSGGASRPWPYFVLLLQQVLGQPPPPCPAPSLGCPLPVRLQSQFQPTSPLPGPSPYTSPTGGLTERREPKSRPVSPESHSASPVRTARPSRRVPRQRPPAVPGTHPMLLRLSTAPQRVPLPSPPASSLPALADPESDSLRAASPTVACLPLHEEIWLRRPPGFTGSFPPGTQWSLRWPVYGLRKAPHQWHDTLRTTLAALGFSSSTADPSLFLRTDTPLPPFYILVYVDDLVFATPDTEALAHVLQHFSFTWSSAQATPLAIGHSLSALPSDESVEPSGPYPELVGCLMYLMTCTRPDLAYPLGLLARYVAPGRHRKVHLDAAKRVLRYLCSTSGMGLVLGGRRSVVLTGHSDASWVDDQATQRSSQGYTFSLSSGSVSWRSTRSSSVLSSSCEAEIYATAMAAQELRWPTYLLTDLGERPSSPPVLYVDNKAAIALCQEHRLEHRTKHIALRYFLARELQQRGQLCLRYVATRANTSDIFTKALQPGDHQRFCTVLGLMPNVPYLLLCGDIVMHLELALPFLTGLVSLLLRYAPPPHPGRASSGVSHATPPSAVARLVSSPSALSPTSSSQSPRRPSVLPRQVAVDFWGATAAGAGAGFEGAGDGGVGAGGPGSCGASYGGADSGGAGAGGPRVGATGLKGCSVTSSESTSSSGSSRSSTHRNGYTSSSGGRHHLTHTMTLRPSSIPQHFVLTLPPPGILDPAYDLARDANPLVSDSDCPLSVGGELALGCDIFEDRQFDRECLKAVVPHLAAMLLASAGDPDALDIPTPRSYADAITGPHSSQCQTAMDAEMAS